jgi:RNA polymerase sigma-70 factor (ECF subfamily)
MALDLEQEKSLLERIQKDRDSEAFVLLYRHYYPQLYGFILKRVAHTQAAEDIVSEVFFKILNNISKFSWQGVPFSAWAYTIASNETNRYFTKAGNSAVSFDYLQQEHGFDVESSENVAGELVEKERVEERSTAFRAVQQSLKKLPEKYQEALALRYFEQKSVLEVSEILGKKEGTIKSLLSRGVEKLRNQLEEDGATLSTLPGYTIDEDLS